MGGSKKGGRSKTEETRREEGPSNGRQKKERTLNHKEMVVTVREEKNKRKSEKGRQTKEIKGKNPFPIRKREAPLSKGENRVGGGEGGGKGKFMNL